MGKKAKQKQTAYTTGGHEISQQAIPYIKQNQEEIANWNSQNRTDDYLNKYYTVDKNADYQDFLRQYNRNMGEAAANNFASTSGGYSSANQRNYDDQQRYENDLATRLYSQGVGNAYNMATQDYNNLLNANAILNNGYQLGKAYSDVDQYNYQVKQMNKNWLGNLMSSAGTVLGKSGVPGLQAIGGVIGTAGGMMTVDSPYLNQMGGGQAGTQGTGAYVSGQNNFAEMFGNSLGSMDNKFGRWFKGKDTTTGVKKG